MTRQRRQPSDCVTCGHCGTEFRAITFRHLRNIHGYDGDHPINDYKRKFHLHSATCRESRKKISTRKEKYWARRVQHWTLATVLAEIRRLHRAGKMLRRRKVPVRLYEAARRLFGTWEQAIERAGLDYETVSGVRRWDRSKVLHLIRQLAADGVPLDAKNIERRYGYSPSSVDGRNRYRRQV